MKKLVVMNPNTSRLMTEAVVALAVEHLTGGTVVVGMTAAEGCDVIDSRETFAVGARAAIGMLRDVPGDTDAILLACFGDPGLRDLRQATDVAVIGLAESVLAEARAAGHRFAIITAGANWVPMLKQCVQECGAADLLVDVYALAGNGKKLRECPDEFRAEVLRLSAVAGDRGATKLILGGAAFAGLDFNVDPRLALMDVMGAAMRRATMAAIRPRRSGGLQSTRKNQIR